MPDPVQYLIALLAAFAVSFVVILIAQRAMRATIPSLARFVFMVGLVLGLLTGYQCLGFEYRWPPVNALDRFLTIVLPALVIIELAPAASSSGDQHEVRFRGVCLLRSAARFVLIVSAGRILWHDSVYLRFVDGDALSTRQHSEAYGVLLASAVILYSARTSLVRLSYAGQSSSVLFSLVISILAAGLSIILVGYIKGGVAALPLAGAIAGAAFAVSLAARKVESTTSASQLLIGIGVTSLFSLLWIGRFFGQLTTFDGLIVFSSPHCCWVTELRPFRACSSKCRLMIRMAAVFLPLLVVLFFKWQQFMHKMAPLIAFQPESSQMSG